MEHTFNKEKFRMVVVSDHFCTNIFAHYIVLYVTSKSYPSNKVWISMALAKVLAAFAFEFSLDITLSSLHSLKSCLKSALHSACGVVQ